MEAALCATSEVHTNIRKKLKWLTTDLLVLLNIRQNKSQKVGGCLILVLFKAKIRHPPYFWVLFCLIFDKTNKSLISHSSFFLMKRVCQWHARVLTQPQSHSSGLSCQIFYKVQKQKKIIDLGQGITTPRSTFMYHVHCTLCWIIIIFNGLLTHKIILSRFIYFTLLGLYVHQLFRVTFNNINCLQVLHVNRTSSDQLVHTVASS